MEQWFDDGLMDSFELRRVDLNTYKILFGGRQIIRLKNCYYISQEFIHRVYQDQKSFYLEDWDEEQIEEIDMSERIDEYIQDGQWDWRNQVAVYKGEDKAD